MSDLVDTLQEAFGMTVAFGPGFLRAVQYTIYQLMHDSASLVGKLGGTIVTPSAMPTTPKPQQVQIADKNAYVAPSATDDRSPCPALNTMANHGYIPRNGRSISAAELTRGLMQAYNLSFTLAAVLSYSTLFALGQAGAFSLHDLARHDYVEHDASITHDNTPKGLEYAPIPQNPRLIKAFILDARSGPGGKLSYEGVAKARARREADPGNNIDYPHQVVGRGEAAIVLGVFGGREQLVPIDVLQSFWVHERLPEGWTRPSYSFGLMGMLSLSNKILKVMLALRRAKKVVTTDELLVDEEKAESVSSEPISGAASESTIDSSSPRTPSDDSFSVYDEKNKIRIEQHSEQIPLVPAIAA